MTATTPTQHPSAELKAAVARSLREHVRRVLANNFHGCSKELYPPYTERTGAEEITAIHAFIFNDTIILCELCAAVLDGIYLATPVPDTDQFPLVRCGQRIPPRAPTEREFPRDIYASLGYKPLTGKLARYLPNQGKVGR